MILKDINIARIGDFVDNHLSKTYYIDVPPFSSIEFSIIGACNRRCIFCPRVDDKQFPNKYESLPLNIFHKIMRELWSIHYTGRISFSGFSEPLLTKNIEEYISCGKKLCPNMTIEIVTNGDCLTLERLKNLFLSGLDNIRISLYDGPHQVKQFQKMQASANLNNKQFILRKRYLPEKDYGMNISNRAGTITLINKYVNVKPLEKSLNQPCHYPFYKMVVDYTGEVVICSNDWLKKRVVGNVKHQTVFEIWNSEGFNQARKNLINSNRCFAPCEKCDVNGLYNGKPHFNAWRKFYET